MVAKTKLTIALTTILVLIIALGIPVVAEEGTYGNAWVYDEPQVISDETEAYIQDLNENTFASYARKPQLAIVIVNDLPYDIDRYKLDLFNEFGVGTAKENCGMLFLFAINDRQYALEIGDGFEKGSLLRKDLETDFITDDMKTLLRSGDYDAVVRQIAEHLAGIMANEESGAYDLWEAEKQAKEKAEAERKAALKAQRTAEMEAIINKVFVIGAIILVACCMIALVAALVKRHLRKKKIQSLCSGYARQLHAARISEEEMAEFLKENHPSADNSILEEKFLLYLRELYLNRQLAALAKSGANTERFALYQDAIKTTNNLRAFQRCEIISTDMIVRQVDKEEDQRQEIRRMNAETIDRFLQENEHRIVHKSTEKAIRARLGKYCRRDELVDEATLEAAFADALKEQNFRWEVEKFAREHRDESGSEYFDRDSFYAMLHNSSHYRDYQYSRNYDNSWMYALYISHIAHRKRLHREEMQRQEARRKAEEARRREREETAALRRATESIRTTNSSFGSSFGGGSSSGGGFKGGW